MVKLLAPCVAPDWVTYRSRHAIIQEAMIRPNTEIFKMVIEDKRIDLQFKNNCLVTLAANSNNIAALKILLETNRVKVSLGHLLKAVKRGYFDMVVLFYNLPMFKTQPNYCHGKTIPSGESVRIHGTVSITLNIHSYQF
jgi:hypothetical protein